MTVFCIPQSRVNLLYSSNFIINNGALKQVDYYNNTLNTNLAEGALKGESSGHTCCIYIAPKVVKMNRRDFLPSSAQAKLIQAGLRLALISSLAGRPA